MPIACAVWWRFKGDGPWKYGWTSQQSAGLVRMGWWHGDTMRGPVVDPCEVEWRKHD